MPRRLPNEKAPNSNVSYVPQCDPYGWNGSNPAPAISWGSGNSGNNEQLKKSNRKAATSFVNSVKEKKFGKVVSAVRNKTDFALVEGLKLISVHRIAFKDFIPSLTQELIAVKADFVKDDS